ncbi:hypothetical protein [Tautonia plasticadhaerens]|uniref:Uncharacterized protein n=1 Tax=Tautonia plasticadhaerens TaxID=2527974 RepID=A0A518H228_9BACT|nr:hypothetical protein [Tautonia plasticadhaerens]QDV34885.1 hypothetical protein ElP_27820 [Tautonia plasticadhaerens]
MKKRVAEQLAEMGYTGTVEEFRRVLAEVKREKYADWTDENLAFTRHQADDYCSEVRKRLSAPKLSRVAILKGLVSLRKNPVKPKPVVAQEQPVS